MHSNNLIHFMEYVHAAFMKKYIYSLKKF